MYDDTTPKLLNRVQDHVTNCDSEECDRIKTVQTKQILSAHIALAYLDGLYANSCDLLQDEEYYRAYKALEKRVGDMLKTPYNGDVTDLYVIVEQED